MDSLRGLLLVGELVDVRQKVFGPRHDRAGQVVHPNLFEVVVKSAGGYDQSAEFFRTKRDEYEQEAPHPMAQFIGGGPKGSVVAVRVKARSQAGSSFVNLDALFMVEIDEPVTNVEPLAG